MSQRFYGHNVCCICGSPCLAAPPSDRAWLSSCRAVFDAGSSGLLAGVSNSVPYLRSGRLIDGGREYPVAWAQYHSAPEHTRVYGIERPAFVVHDACWSILLDVLPPAHLSYVPLFFRDVWQPAHEQWTYYKRATVTRASVLPGLTLGQPGPGREPAHGCNASAYLKRLGGVHQFWTEADYPEVFLADPSTAVLVDAAAQPPAQPGALPRGASSGGPATAMDTDTRAGCCRCADGAAAPQPGPPRTSSTSPLQQQHLGTDSGSSDSTTRAAAAHRPCPTGLCAPCTPCAAAAAAARAANGACPLASLPVELLEHVALHLDAHALAQLRCTCRQLSGAVAAFSALQWAELCHAHFPRLDWHAAAARRTERGRWQHHAVLPALEQGPVGAGGATTVDGSSGHVRRQQQHHGEGDRAQGVDWRATYAANSTAPGTSNALRIARVAQFIAREAVPLRWEPDAWRRVLLLPLCLRADVVGLVEDWAREQRVARITKDVYYTAADAGNVYELLIGAA